MMMLVVVVMLVKILWKRKRSRTRETTTKKHNEGEANLTVQQCTLNHLHSESCWTLHASANPRPAAPSICHWQGEGSVVFEISVKFVLQVGTRTQTKSSNAKAEVQNGLNPNQPKTVPTPSRKQSTKLQPAKDKQNFDMRDLQVEPNTLIDRLIVLPICSGCPWMAAPQSSHPWKRSFWSFRRRQWLRNITTMASDLLPMSCVVCWLSSYCLVTTHTPFELSSCLVICVLWL